MSSGGAGLRTAGAAAGEERAAGLCPRCREAFDAEQEYCLECGLRLPWDSPVFTRLTARAAGRTPFLPREWIWPAILALLVAAAGAAAAIAVTRDDAGAQDEAIAVATGGNPPADPEPAALPTAPEPAPGVKTSTVPPRQARPAARRPGLVRWPRGRNGWTIVLVSLPQSGGGERARETARAALERGLREVGVLDSNRWASLHPGYYVVFTGIYASPEEAAGALQRAKAAYPLAYTREIAA
jgi:hypothetical protein